MNYNRFLTKVSQNRNTSMIRELIAILSDASPELIFLAGGMPNVSLFPFKSATFELAGEKKITLDSSKMSSALQYGPTQGYPKFVDQLKSLQKHLHSPPLWDNTDLVVTPGSQDGLCKAFEMIMEPNDYVVVPEPCYTGTLSILEPYEAKYLAIDSDDEGMIPESFNKVMSAWDGKDMKNKNTGVPKILYVNPFASNPTGMSITTERRKSIYSIASKYDLLIFEDDPYYFLQFEETLSPSFLSLDTEGRVLRFDSFSKVLSSGMRLGFVTGPKVLIDRIMMHMQACILHTSSLTQVLASELLSDWGDEGFKQHTKDVQSFYKAQRDAMLGSAERHLTGLCEWSVPTGGMFLWFKVPQLSDTSDLILQKGLSKNVLLVPGSAFTTDSSKPSNYMRAAFSLATPEKIEQGMANLAVLIKEEIQLQTKS